jgi:hypothetical protein
MGREFLGTIYFMNCFLEVLFFGMKIFKIKHGNLQENSVEYAGTKNENR